MQVRACAPQFSLLPGAWHGSCRLPNWLTAGIDFAPSARYALGRALEQLACDAGDEVLVPRIHCIAVIAPLRHLGLVPVFYDVDENFDPILSSVQSGMKVRTRAIVFIHYFGKLASTSSLAALMQSAGVAVIWDCAHAWLSMLASDEAPENVDFIIASTMKFQATSDGGVLWSAPAGNKRERKLRRRYKTELRAALSFVKSGWAQQLSSRPPSKEATTILLPPTDTAALAPLSVDAASYGVEKHNAPCTFAAQRVTLSTNWSAVAQKRITYYNRMRDIVYSCFPNALVIPQEAGARFVPYVFPIIVAADRARDVHHGLRAAGIQSQRWDVFDPMLSEIDERTARILMLPCHEGLSEREVHVVANTIVDQITLHSGGSVVGPGTSLKGESQVNSLETSRETP